ncbi:hypothetical protein JXA34_03310 [Patescibacteria group bacterium]|nr:hypothetical protein [Patescibacteria group bacterium]
MQYALTTCSKDKDASEIPLPAIQRYTDKRISYVHMISEKRSLPMIIFSGKFGILKTDDLIPFYDLKLEEKLVNEMVEKVVLQFEKLNATEIDFYGLDVNTHVDWEPYYAVIKDSCEQLDIKLNIINLDEGDYEKE